MCLWLYHQPCIEDRRDVLVTLQPCKLLLIGGHVSDLGNPGSVEVIDMDEALQWCELLGFDLLSATIGKAYIVLIDA